MGYRRRCPNDVPWASQRCPLDFNDFPLNLVSRQKICIELWQKYWERFPLKIVWGNGFRWEMVRCPFFKDVVKPSFNYIIMYYAYASLKYTWSPQIYSFQMVVSVHRRVPHLLSFIDFYLSVIILNSGQEGIHLNVHDFQRERFRIDVLFSSSD